jgi:hypothetical protein
MTLAVHFQGLRTEPVTGVLPLKSGNPKGRSEGEASVGVRGRVVKDNRFCRPSDREAIPTLPGQRPPENGTQSNRASPGRASSELSRASERQERP